MAHDTQPNAERPAALSFLSGGGELGALIRAFDWAKTPLGAPEGWPQGLQTAVRIMLTSRQPFWIGWGRELTYLYNDPYKAIIGGKHPVALGQPAAVVWREIWNDIAPLLDTAMSGIEGTYVEAKLLIMERHGYPEETYYTFSYSPIPDEKGAAGGIICANTDDTQRVIGERQLALLKELAAGTANARSWQEACERSARALATDAFDLPFALIYAADSDRATLSLVGASGIAPGHAAAPNVVRLDGASPWPFRAILREREGRLCDLPATFGRDLPTGAWSLPPARAAVLPIHSTVEQGRTVVLVAALSPFRRYDEDYRGFIELVAGQIGAAIASAQAYEAERQRAEALAEIDRAKTLFFSNVSHELRTPLTLMLGPLEDALAKLAREREGELRPLVETAHRNGLRLLNLVNSLLDFSRIEAGRVDAHFEPTDLAGFTAELASGFRSVIDKAGLRLVVRCARLPEPVHVDRDMWEKLVLNLMSNAFKFTFDGEIEVATGASADGKAAELTVRDTGTGIPAHELPRLFERFHRIEGASGRSIEGSGIGLALVQELVKLHGGSIRVASELGRGSAFTVSMPFGTAHLPPDRLSGATAKPPMASRARAYAEEALRWLPGATEGGADGMAGAPSQSAAEDIGVRRAFAPAHGDRVLLADDNADMRAYVRRLLIEQGYVVEAVSDGQAALAAARRTPPDLILSDVMMPGLDGFGLLRALRADPPLRAVPVVLLSARAGEEAQVEGLDAGADDYLTKPFSARELLARVGTNLQMARLRREAAEALRARTDELETLLETVPTAVWFTRDPDASHIWGNRQAALMLRQSEGSNLSLTAPRGARPTHFRMLRDGVEIAPPDMPVQRAARGEEVRGEELDIRFDDGSSIVILVHATPLRDAAGVAICAVAAAADITTHKQAQAVLRDVNQALEERVAAEMKRREQAEAALRQSQKMEAIGQLTGGVAHDFNNLLLVIQGNLEALERQAAKSGTTAEPLARPIRSALKGVERATILNHRLLAFARQQPLAPEPVDANKLVGGMSELLHRTLGEGTAIETVLSSGLWRTFADPNQLENALLNLAVNARDAMPDGGKLTIETANSFLDEAYAAAHHEVAPGQYVAIAVSDTGIGMSKEGVEKAFEPFYTTKAPGRGTGLGLSQVYGFAKQSGGHAKIYSEPGHGTTVRLYLPRYMAPADELHERAPVPETAAPRGRGREMILVVEDDDDVRAGSVRSLRELGYRVVEARDGAAALRVLERESGIDLIFTDVGLPGGMNGRQVADEARRRWPRLRVLFTTGYARNAIVHHGRLDPGVELIVKPYTFSALARKIRAALDGGA